MQSVREQYHAVMHAKSAREFFQNIPWGFIEILAAVPAAVFILSAFYQLIVILTVPYGYSAATAFARKIGLIFGGLMIILYAGKKTAEGEQAVDFCRRSKPFVFFLAVMFLMVISTCINGFTPKALHGDVYRNESLFAFLMYFGIYYFCCSVIGRKKIKVLLEYLFVFVTFSVNGTVLFATYVLNNRAFYTDELLGIFSQFNHYGYYLLLTIVLSSALTLLETNRVLKCICFLNFVSGTVLLIINNTFGCFLSCIAALIFSVIAVSVYRRKFSWGAAGMLLMFLLITFLMSFWMTTFFSNLIWLKNDIAAISSGDEEQLAYAGTGRWALWRETVQSIRERPLFGWGVEGIQDRLYIASGIYQNNRPHNEYLQYAAFFGVPAALLYLCGLFSLLCAAWKNRRITDGYSVAALCTAAAYLCSALFGNTMHYTAPYLFIFLGLSFLPAGESKNRADAGLQPEESSAG